MQKMNLKQVSPRKGRKILIDDFIFSIENLNLEFCKYPSIHDSDFEFDVLFSEINQKEIPYYCYDNDYYDTQPICYYLDIGYQVNLLEIKRKLIILNKINNHEQNLIENLKLNGFKVNECKKILDWFKNLLAQINIKNIDFLEKESSYDNYDGGEFLSRYFFEQKEVKKYITADIDSNNIALGLCVAHPFLILEYLLANPANHNFNIQLRTKKLKNKIQPKINVILEGSSDVKILEKMFTIKGADIKDFFHFTNSHQNGSGNGASANVKFFLDQTIIKTNNIFLFLFDNDIAGNHELDKCIKPPKNILLKSLPNLNKEYFKNIKILNDKDECINNYKINGQAVAIEFFLDLNFGSLASHPPIILIDKNMQGRFKNKDKYSKSFLHLKNEYFQEYDFSKINILIDFIFQESLSLF
jgi:hypothetical protein